MQLPKQTSVRTLATLLAYARERGLAPGVLVDGEAAALARRAESFHRVALRTVADAMERAATQLDDPLFGARYAQELDASRFGPISLFWRYAPTLLYNHRASARFVHLHQEGTSAALAVEGPEATFNYVMDAEIRRDARHFVESALSFCLRIGRWTLGPTWAPLRIAFAHAPGCDVRRYEDLLQAPVVFGAPENAMVVRTADLNRQASDYDRELLAFVERSLIALADREPLNFRERLERTVDDQLVTQGPRLAAAAAAMGLSGRSLQRRLQAEGLSFQTVVRERRLNAIARAQLRSSRPSLALLAQRSGFSEPSAVSRFMRLNAHDRMGGARAADDLGPPR